MRVEVFWINECGQTCVGIMARPRGGDWLEDEIESLKALGVDIIVSLLTDDEVLELDLSREEQLCVANDMDFVSFPIIDRDVPSLNAATYETILKLANEAARGKHIVIHCRMGIGRSSLVAATILVVRGVPVSDVFKIIENSRGRPVPDTIEQVDWVERFAKRFLE